jgi:hypothetical protein
MQMERVAILFVLGTVAEIANGFETGTGTERQPGPEMSGLKLVAAKDAWRTGCAVREACLQLHLSGRATLSHRTSAHVSATWGERRLCHSCAFWKDADLNIISGR